jgi:hypothetical protein
MAAQDCRLFRPPQTVIPSAQGYAVADLNGDGKTDIVAVVGGNLEVYLSNGPSFAAPVTVQATLAAGVLIGDLNNDGKPDIVGVSTDNEHIVVYLNNGDGTFAAGLPYQVPPGLAAVGDLNGDGFADLVFVIQAPGPFQDSHMAILINDGHGGFGQPERYSLGRHPNSIAIADFNKDGYNDIALVDYGGPSNNVSPYPGNVMIFTSTSSGALFLSQTIELGPQAGMVTVGDFNGDGYPDLAINVINGNDQLPGVFSLLLNDHGRFSSITNYTVGGYNAGIIAGDFNQDGYVDLAVTSLDKGDVVIYLNGGTGLFVPAQKISVSDGPANNIVGDFNGDGRLDFASLNVGDSSVSVFYNDETRPAISLTASPNPSEAGQPVTLTAAVSVPVSSACTLNGGTVTFLDSGKAIGRPVAINSEGQAVIMDSSLATGTHSLTARFNPAALSMVGRRTSSVVSQVVQ